MAAHVTDLLGYDARPLTAVRPCFYPCQVHCQLGVRSSRKNARAAQPTSRARGLPLRQFSIALAACVLARAEAYTPKRTAVSLSDRATAAASPPPPASAKCAKCGFNADGHGNCCTVGGSWHGTCGDGLEHTPQEGFIACKGVAPEEEYAPGEEQAWGEGEEHAWEVDHVPPPESKLVPESKHPALVRNATLEQQLKHALLAPLDPMIPPSTGEQGIRVSVQYRIFKVIKVDISSGELTLKIWRRTVWYDPRLQWDPKEWGGISGLRAYPTSTYGVDEHLWRPPLVTTNTIASEQGTIETGGAWIRSDGRVWHSVPGIIDLSCRFTGLVNFPNDQLTCAMEVGSWTYSDKVVNLTYFSPDLPWGWPAAPDASGHTWTNVGTSRPTWSITAGTESGPPTELINGGIVSLLRAKWAQSRALPGEPTLTVKVTAGEWDALNVSGLKRNHFVNVDGNYFLSQDPLPCAELGAQSRASGYSYQEYEVKGVECRSNTRTYPVDPDDHWTALWLIVHITRKSAPYYFLCIIVPGILVTLLSFFPFWLDVTETGTRTSFGATMLLTILVLMTIVGQVVPRCGEMLWIHLVNWTNFVFCLIATIQGYIVAIIATGGDFGHAMAGKESDKDADHEKFHRMRQQGEARARAVDYWCRRVLPTCYLIVITFVLTADVNDDYGANYALPMFKGFSGWQVDGVKHKWLLITSIVLVTALCLMQFQVIFSKFRRNSGQAVSGSV